MPDRSYIAIDLKSFYASVACVGREFDPLTTNLVVADLEPRLSDEGWLDEFRAAFEEEYGLAWEASRQDFDFRQELV